MSSIHLVANEVLFTSYGHLQLVFDPDGSFDNGDELEVEVQGPFLAIGDWDVRPEQSFAIPFGADSQSRELILPTGVDAADIWTALVNTRDFLATQDIDYRLGLVGALEGQNSNSYITTLAHVVGLDITGAASAILATPDFSSFPGLARNVLFDHVAADDSVLPPIALNIAGSDGADRLSGGAGGDRIDAAGGQDTVFGLGGADTLTGGGNRDHLYGGDDHDTLIGEKGNDRLFGETGDDTLLGDTGNDRLRGGTGDDILQGGKGRDRLFGNGGADDLSGGSAADLLRGGGGSDRLTGMTGADTLTGGAGADRFVFDGKVMEGKDTITDFVDGVDLIEVQGLTWTDLTIGGTGDARVTLNGLTQITLVGIADTTLGADDFVFV